MKKLNKKGFTLAELLIVVAIIAVLVAIAIPVFTAQLEKSREATDLANVRSGYATVVISYLDKGTAASISVSAHQKQSKWQCASDATSFALTVMNASGTKSVLVPAKTSGKYKVAISTGGTVTVS